MGNSPDFGAQKWANASRSVAREEQGRVVDERLSRLEKVVPAAKKADRKADFSD